MYQLHTLSLSPIHTSIYIHTYVLITHKTVSYVLACSTYRIYSMYARVYTCMHIRTHTYLEMHIAHGLSVKHTHTHIQ